MVAARQTAIYRRTRQGGDLSAREREELAKPFLPSPPEEPKTSSNRQSNRHSPASFESVSRAISKQIHFLIFTAIHILFSVYIRIRKAKNNTLDRIFSILYYHHRTPELIKRDVQNLDRLPEHVSVILSLDESLKRKKTRGDLRVGTAEFEALVDDVAEIAAWCTCAGIPMLSVYETSGILKRYMPTLSHTVTSKLRAYHGPKHPTLQLAAPHMPTMVNGELLEKHLAKMPNSDAAANLSLLLISAEDGRDSVVDLTKTLTEMSQRGKIDTSDINLPLVDAELVENVMDEPDLLILFDPLVNLHSYPPWQLRLTEIFHVPDNEGVGYQVFLRGLYSYAKAQMRFGR